MALKVSHHLFKEVKKGSIFYVTDKCFVILNPFYHPNNPMKYSYYSIL